MAPVLPFMTGYPPTPQHSAHSNFFLFLTRANSPLGLPRSLIKYNHEGGKDKEPYTVAFGYCELCIVSSFWAIVRGGPFCSRGDGSVQYLGPGGYCLGDVATLERERIYYIINNSASGEL